MIFLRIGRFGILYSSVPSCAPMIGSRSFAELVKISIVDPHVLRELELANQARAPDERRDAPFDAVVRRAFGKRRTVGAAARIIRRRFMFAAVSRGFMRRMCEPSGTA